MTRTYLWPPFSLGFLSRPRTPGRSCEDLRVERVLAFSRLLVSLTCLFAWLFYPSPSLSHYRIALAILLLYVACSIILLLLVEVEGTGPSFAIWAQTNDLTWPALFCLVANVPHRPFFVLFLFATIAAAFRWGLAETMATASFSVVLLLVQPWVAAHGPAALQGSSPTSDPIRLAMQCIFLFTAGVLLGFLAEAEKDLRAEIALTNRLLSLSRMGNRFSSVLQSVLSELGNVLCGTAVHELVAQSSTGRAFRWDVPLIAHPGIQATEIPPTEQAADLMTKYPHTFYMRRNGTGTACSVTAIDEEGRRLESAQTEGLTMPMADAESLLVVSHEMGRDWTGRLVVVNPKLGCQREPKLRFLQDVTQQVAPALYSVYLLWGFRSRASATERARVARELHDTTIQSLIGIEMQLDVLRRRSDSQQAVELDRIQGMLRHEVLNLRELMQTMRPVDIGPHQFLDFIADLVERFSRDTGIAVRFISELREVTLPAATCRELVRIVQESLVNIRKHSGAQSAVARFASHDGLWKLVIKDDGNGFPFAGSFTLAELDALRRGPAVIKERVRAIRGDMVIESIPGHGSRLEITIPQKGYELYG